MAIGIKTEKAIKEVIKVIQKGDPEAKEWPVYVSHKIEQSGNITFQIRELVRGTLLATFSLKSIISKRYPKRKKK